MHPIHGGLTYLEHQRGFVNDDFSVVIQSTSNTFSVVCLNKLKKLVMISQTVFEMIQFTV